MLWKRVYQTSKTSVNPSSKLKRAKKFFPEPAKTLDKPVAKAQNMAKPEGGKIYEVLEWLKTLHEAETLLETGYKAGRDPFVGYLLALAYFYDASPVTRHQGYEQQLLSVLQHFMPAALIKQITEVKATKRPDPLAVVEAIHPKDRRPVKAMLGTYREWLMLRKWIETIEPGKPRVRKQIRPTEEEKQLARYLEQVIARL